MINKIQVLLRHIGRTLLEFIYPPLCVVCDQELNAPDTLVCQACWGNLRRVDGVVEHGIIERSFIDEIRSGFYYDERLQTIVHFLKYYQATKLAETMAELITPVIRQNVLWAQADSLVPIPLHKAKARERGYNQAEEIAKHLSSRTGIPLQPELLRRRINTVSQTQMKNAQERVHNMKNVFEVRQPMPGKTIILVDDVITTGATANACAEALKQAGAARVLMLSIARPYFE